MTQDSSSLTEPQHAPADKSPPQRQHGPSPGIDSQSPTKSSKYGASRSGHGDPSQQLLAQAQGDKGDPSTLSITMLSSDYSSFQQKASMSKPPPLSSKAFHPPLRASPGGPVTVPTGEMEPSEQSFESSSVTTASEESTAQDTTSSSTLFQRVQPPRLTSTTTAPAQPPKTTELSVSDMTGSDVQELTSTTSNSASSAGGCDSSGSSGDTSGGVDGDGGVGGSLRPPIKGILKRPADRRTHPSSVAAPSAHSRRGKCNAVPPVGAALYACTCMYLSYVGEGVHKLVSVIRAQHQAWSERLAARASLLQSTISQMEEGTATTAPFPTSPAEQSEAGGTRHSFPAPRIPAHEHFQEEQADVHTHPSVSAHRSEVGALRHHSHPSPPLQMHNIQGKGRSTVLTQPSLSLHHDEDRALHQHSQSSPPSQSEGRALNHHHVPLSYNQAGGGVRQGYSSPAFSSQRGDDRLSPSLLAHVTGVKEGGPQVLAPGTSGSHHDSLSIFTLSTRYEGNY